MACEHTQVTVPLTKKNSLCEQGFKALEKLLSDDWGIVIGTTVPPREQCSHGGILYILRREIEV